MKARLVRTALCALLAGTLAIGEAGSALAAQAKPRESAKTAAESVSSTGGGAEKRALVEQYLKETAKNRSASSQQQMIGNEYLEFMVDSRGRFTIGNTGGNPDYETDDNKILIYGHSYPSTSFSTVRLQSSRNETKDFYFEASENQYDPDQKTATSIMELDGAFNDGEEYHFTVTQRLEFVKSSQQRADTVKISYTIKNKGTQAQKAGIRIMMDTMLASHDDAPFAVVEHGNITSELELSGMNVPPTYQVYDVFGNPTTIATGTLYLGTERRPDKVQFTYWPSIYNTLYNYTIGNTTFGDTAVGIYFDPVSLNASASTKVCTYYGANSNLVSGNENEDLDKIDKNSFGVVVYDSLTEKEVPGATVTINGVTKTTNQDGLAVFPNVKDIDKQTKTVTASKTGYRTTAVPRNILRGSFCGVMIVSSRASDEPSFLSAVLQSGSNEYDLTTTCVYYDEADGTETADDSIVIDVKNSGTANKYQLVQAGEVKYESTDGKFTIPIVTKDHNGTPYAVPRIKGLSAGKIVELQMTSTGFPAKITRLGLIISVPPKALAPSANITLGDKISFRVPETVPFLGGSDVGFGIQEQLPVRVEQDKNKVKVMIGAESTANAQTFKDAFGKMKSNILKSLKNGEAGYTFAGTYGAGLINMKCRVIGYGEGTLDKDGIANVDVNIVVGVSEEQPFTKKLMAGDLPTLVTIGEKAEFAFTIPGRLTIDGSNASFMGGTAKIKPSFSLDPQQAVGINGAISASVLGSPKIDWEHQFATRSNSVKLTGSLKIKSNILLFHRMDEIFTGTNDIDIYSGSQRISAYGAGQRTVSFEESDYEFVSRDLASARTAGSNIVLSSMYPDVKEVTAGGKRYRFFLADVASRSSADRSAVAYQKYENGVWSDPQLLLSGDKDDGTADAGFALAAEGNNIHVVWQNMGAAFNSNSASLANMISNSQIKYCRLDASNDTVSNVVALAAGGGAFLPAISAENGNAKIAWFTNSDNSIYGSSSGDNSTDTISCVEVNNGTAGAVSDMTMAAGKRVISLSVGKLNNQDVLVYALASGNDLADSNRTIALHKCAFPASGSSTAAQLSASDAATSTNAKFANLGSTPAMFYYSNGNIAYTTDGSTINKVFNDNNLPNGLNDSFTILSGNGKSVILWTAQAEQNTQKQIIYAVNYDGSKWSGAYILKTVNAETVSAPTGYIDSAGKLVLSYGWSSGNASEIISETIAPFTDISLDNVDFEQNGITPGSSSNVTFKIDLTNRGAKKVSGVTVELLNANGRSVCSETLSNVNLDPGESVLDAAVQTSFTGPQNSSEYTVKVSASGESNLSDNTKIIRIGCPDLAVTQNARFLMNESEYIALDVRNESHYAAQNVRVRVFADSQNGAIIYDRRLARLEGNGEQILNLNIDQLSNTRVAYAVVSSDSADYMEANNTEMLVINPFGRQEASGYDFSISAQEGGRIVEGTRGRYNEGDTINIQAAANEGYRFTGWQMTAGSVADESALSTVFTMPRGTATVIAGFESMDDPPEPETDGPETALSIPSGSALLYSDYQNEKPVTNAMVLYGNGATLTTASGKVNNRICTVYTDILASYSYENLAGGKVKTSVGKIIVGVTKSDQRPAITKNKITDTSASKIAKASIRNGQITVTAVGKEGGPAYLWVMDTASQDNWACLPIYVKLAPKKMEVWDRLSGSKLTNPKLENGKKLRVDVKGFLGQTETEYATYTAAVDSKYAGYVTVTQTSGRRFTITATGLKNNKDTKASITFQCSQNGKKMKFALTVTPAPAQPASP